MARKQWTRHVSKTSDLSGTDRLPLVGTFGLLQLLKTFILHQAVGMPIVMLSSGIVIAVGRDCAELFQ